MGAHAGLEQGVHRLRQRAEIDEALPVHGRSQTADAPEQALPAG